MRIRAILLLLLAGSLSAQRFEGKWTVVASNSGAKGQHYVITNNNGSYYVELPSGGVSAGTTISWYRSGTRLIGSQRPTLQAWQQNWPRVPASVVRDAYPQLEVRREIRFLDEDRIEFTENGATILWNNPAQFTGVRYQHDRWKDIAIRATRENFLKAQKYMREGKSEEAAAELNAAERIDPGDPRITLLRKDLESVRAMAAEKSARQYIRDNPRDALGYVMLGNVLRINGKTQDAIIAYENALRLDATNTQAKQHLAALNPPPTPPATTAVTPPTPDPAGSGKPEPVSCSKCQADLDLEDKRCKAASSDLLKQNECLNAAIKQMLKCSSSCVIDRK